MMAMAQLLSIRMPVSYEVTFPPQNPDVAGVDGTIKGPGQSGMHIETIFALSCCVSWLGFFNFRNHKCPESFIFSNIYLWRHVFFVMPISRLCEMSKIYEMAVVVVAHHMS